MPALAIAELHALDNDLRHIAFHAVVGIVAARLDASLDGNLTSLCRVLTDDLRCLFPCDAGDEVRLLIPVRALSVVNRKREFRARFAALRVPQGLV